MSATIDCHCQSEPVFLQTIKVAVSSGTGSLCAEANILFDLGSQNVVSMKKPVQLEEYLPGSQMITGEIDILVGGFLLVNYEP